MAGRSGDDCEELLFAANFASNASSMLLNPATLELCVRLFICMQKLYKHIGP